MEPARHAAPKVERQVVVELVYEEQVSLWRDRPPRRRGCSDRGSATWRAVSTTQSSARKIAAATAAGRASQRRPGTSQRAPPDAHRRSRRAAAAGRPPRGTWRRTWPPAPPHPGAPSGAERSSIPCSAAAQRLGGGQRTRSTVKRARSTSSLAMRPVAHRGWGRPRSTPPRRGLPCPEETPAQPYATANDQGARRERVRQARVIASGRRPRGDRARERDQRLQQHGVLDVVAAEVAVQVAAGRQPLPAPAVVERTFFGSQVPECAARAPTTTSRTSAAVPQVPQADDRRCPRGPRDDLVSPAAGTITAARARRPSAAWRIGEWGLPRGSTSPRRRGSRPSNGRRDRRSCPSGRSPSASPTASRRRTADTLATSPTSARAPSRGASATHDGRLAPAVGESQAAIGESSAPPQR